MEEVKIHSRPFSPEDPKTHQPSARNLEAHPDVTLQDLLTSKDSPTSHDAGVSVGAAEKTLGDMNSPLASQGPHLLPPQKEERTLSMGASGPRTASPHEEALEPLHGKQSWCRPRENVWRMGSVCLAFLNFGLNDASYGVCCVSCF